MSMRNTKSVTLQRLLLWLLLIIAQQLLVVENAQAQARAFTQRFNANANGDIRLIGNTVKTCDPAGAVGAANCLAARNATTANNDDGSYSMIDVNVEGAPYFNSSTATLSLPAGSTVLFAGLYWGARSASAARGQVLFRTAASTGYSPVNATVIDSGGGGSSNNYQAFADVTTQVAAAGNGTYGVANIQANNGNDAGGFWGGWSLVIAYQNMGESLKNLAVYDGYQVVTAGGSITVTPSGFLTPLSGTVNARVGSVVYDGDAGPGAFALSETVTINGNVLSNGVNPANDVFNSTISDLGGLVTTRTPSDRNTFGFDVDRFAVTAGWIPNGATSATVTMTSATGGETYYAQVLTTAIELYVPVITPNVTKTVADLNGGALLPGETLRWTINLSNTGIDTGTNVILKDPIPANTTYVANSLSILTGANSGAKSDTPGNDQAEFSASAAACAPVAAPCVIFRLGTGANATNGGNIALNESTSLQFDTTVNAGVTSGTLISNTASISYSGQTLGSTFSTSSAAASLVVQAPPLITMSFGPNPIPTGGTSVLSITVSNPAGSPTTMTGVTFSDTYPANLVNTATPSPAVTCTGGATAGTITGGAAGGNTIGMNPGATLPPGTSCTITVNVTSSFTNNYTNTTGPVSSTNAGTGGTATAILGVGKPAITKDFLTTTILSGGTSTVRFTLTNPTSLVLSGVAFSDPLTNMQVAAVPAVTNTCGGTVTANPGAASISLGGGNLGATGTCVIEVNVTSTTTGIHPNTTTGVSSTQTGGAGPISNSPTLTVIGAPVATKQFSPTSIQTTGANPGAASTLIISITNPNTAFTMTGVNFTDNFPQNVGGVGAADLLNASVPNATINCSAGSTATLSGGVAGGTFIGMSGGTLLPGGICTVTVRVSAAATANYNNNTGPINTTNAGTGTAAAATLNVTNLTPPTVAKAFAATNLAAGGTTTLTITLTNPQGTAITGVAFTDIYPAGVFNTATPGVATTCGGAPVTTAAANGSSVSLSGATIPGSGSCTVTVQVTSSLPGLKQNFINAGEVTTANAGVNTTNISANMNVFAPPQISKVFSPTAIGTDAGDFSQMTITITNPAGNPANLTGINFTDTFPTNVIVHTTVGSANTCGGTYTDAGGGGLGSGDTGVRLTGVTLAPGASCLVRVNVRSNTAGTYTNTTGNVAATGPMAITGSNASAILAVGRPGITKSFGTSPIVAGATSIMTITLTNGTGTAMTGAAFTDTYPVTMTNAAAPNPTRSANCGVGTVLTAVPNGPSFSVSNANIPANSTCVLTVTVTASATSINTIPAGGLTVTGPTAQSNAVAATATLVVTPPLTVVKSYSDSTIAVGGTTVLTITLTNPTGAAITGAAFTDNYPNSPAQMRNHPTTPNASHTCAGAPTLTAAANGTSLAFSNATVPANSSCSVSVTITVPTAGSYVNATGPVTTTSAGTAPSVTATLTALPPPTMTKLVTVISDPINGTLNPKAIPGAVVEYTLLVTNATVALDVNTVIISDPINTNIALCVAAVCGVAGSPVTFSQGSVSSGLTYTYVSAASNTDDFEHFDSGNVRRTAYTPSVSGNTNGCDPGIARIQINPKGVFASGEGISPQPSFVLRYRACIK